MSGGQLFWKVSRSRGEIDRRRMSRVILLSWWSLIQSTFQHALSSAEMTQSKDEQKKTTCKWKGKPSAVTSSNLHRVVSFFQLSAQLEYIIIIIQRPERCKVEKRIYVRCGLGAPPKTNRFASRAHLDFDVPARSFSSDARTLFSLSRSPFSATGSFWAFPPTSPSVLWLLFGSTEG
jgi:hypothetical protein